MSTLELEVDGLRMRETVLCETFAAFATSRIVTVSGWDFLESDVILLLYAIFYAIVCGTTYDSIRLHKSQQLFIEGRYAKLESVQFLLDNRADKRNNTMVTLPDNVTMSQLVING